MDDRTFLDGFILHAKENATTDSPQAKITCPVSSLPSRKEGDSLLITLQSSQKCNLNHLPVGAAFSLQIENAMKEELNVKVGPEIRNWKGGVVRLPDTVTLNPLIIFLGTLEALSIGSSL